MTNLPVSERLWRFYKRWLSPLLQHYFGVRCRFEPSCSRYAATAIQRFGWFAGIWLGITRLLRCQPWGQSGIDPVPDQFRWLGSRVQTAGPSSDTGAHFAEHAPQHVHCSDCQPPSRADDEHRD